MITATPATPTALSGYVVEINGQRLIHDEGVLSLINAQPGYVGRLYVTEMESTYSMNGARLRVPAVILVYEPVPPVR